MEVVFEFCTAGSEVPGGWYKVLVSRSICRTCTRFSTMDFQYTVVHRRLAKWYSRIRNLCHRGSRIAE
eukprot:1298387-Rhodomonas_salina.1